jgi:DNA polymerase-1
MSDRKRLALIDGHALAFRAFHAMRDAGLRSSSGEPTYAIFGFAQLLLTMIQEQQPQYVAVAFDVGRTFRDDMFAEYKAGRAETPEEFHPQLKRIQQLIETLNIPIYTADGYEADDVIGTLSEQAAALNVETIILTGDTDTLQLVNDHVRVLLANPYAKGGKNTTLYDEPAVRERYEGLAPAQLADLRGLKGDVSDNIPGVKGIGEKGAINLLNQFGSVEAIFDRFDELPNRYKKPLDGQRQIAEFSKRLATIVCAVPSVQLDLDAAALGDYDRSAVIRLFQELEIGANSNLIKKLPATSSDPTPVPELASAPAVVASRPATDPLQHDMFDAALPATLPPPAVDLGGGTLQLSMFDEPAVAAPAPLPVSAHGDYTAITSEAQLSELLNQLNAAPGFAFDTEGSGLRPFESELAGISIAIAPGSAVYIPVGHATGEQLPRELVVNALRPYFENPALPKYAHNAKFDIEMLTSAGIELRGLAFDTMIAAGLLGKQRVGLKELAFYELRLPEPMTPIEELIGRGSKQISFDQVPVERATPYAAADADMTLRLKLLLEEQLAQFERINNLFLRLELPLVPVLVEMERAGITLDKGYIQALGARLEERIRTIEAEIHEAAGGPFNINSGAQLNQVLFDSGTFGLDPKTLGLSRLKTGGYSITAEVLEQMAPLAPIAERILRYRQLSKLKSTYIDALPTLVNPRTGRVHTSYNQIGAATGRLSCLPSGTLVNTQRGLVGIETVRPGDIVRTAFGPHAVTAWAATGEKPVVVLRLSNGITLRCSPEHQLRSLGQWVKAADLQVGSPLYMSYAPGIFGDETQFVVNHTSHYDTRKTPSLPDAWSVELAELVGYHMAHGQIARSNYNGKPSAVILAFGWDDEELIDYMAEHIQQLFGKTPKRRDTSSCPVLSVAGVDIAGMFEQLGAGGKSGVIRVPQSLYRAPEQIVAGFLRGYFEGDGSVQADTISVRAVSLGMLEDVQQLLTLFGITSRLTPARPDPRGYAQRHTLRIAGRRSNELFFTKIGFLATKKHLLAAAAAMQHPEPHTTRSPADLITLMPGFEMGAIKPVLYAACRDDQGQVPGALHQSTAKLSTGRQTQITLPRAEWMTAALPENLCDASTAFLDEAVRGRYFEVYITAIEHSSPVPMYDISVENVHQYIANGIVLHNSIDPNLQNIPVRTEEGREIRRGFVAAPGHKFVAADYSQIELRVLAHVTKDPALLATFREGRDIHATTASRLFGVDEKAVDKNQRRIAKTTVFGIVYGISSFGLSQRLGLDRATSQELINGVFASFPGIKAYIDEVQRSVRETGYVSTLFGRRRHFAGLAAGDRGPQAQAALREAINAPIQGTAADLMKIAMVNTKRALDESGLAARLLLQVHDELILEAPDAEVPAVAALVCRTMEGAYQLDVPLGVEVESGPNWEELKPVHVERDGANDANPA